MNYRTFKIIFTSVFMLSATSLTQAAESVATENPQKASTPEKSDIPKVMIIGDSISSGYTQCVVDMLKEVAIVERCRANAGDTGRGLKHLDKWLGKTKWDVIHFNWGLWDLCYRHPDSKVQGNRDKVNGTITTTLEQYEKNLDQLVTRLEKTNATLIWAHTTVVPEKEAGRFVGDDKKYNEVAAKIMKKHNVRINDLNKLSSGLPSQLFSGPGNVHFKPEGYKQLGRQVAREIRSVLKGAPESAKPSEK